MPKTTTCVTEIDTRFNKWRVALIYKMLLVTLLIIKCEKNILNTTNF